MRRTEIRKLPLPRLRDWNAWARRVRERIRRGFNTDPASLVWRVARSRSSFSIAHHWFRPALHFHPQFFRSGDHFAELNSFPDLTQIFKQQASPVTRTRVAERPPSLPARAPISQVIRTVPLVRVAHRHTFTRVEQVVRADRPVAIASGLSAPGSDHDRISARAAARRERSVADGLPERRLTLRSNRVSPTPSHRAAQPSQAAEGPRSPHSAAAGGPPAEPPINLDHLVDRVIQQIDRRVVARRERMGRI